MNDKVHVILVVAQRNRRQLSICSDLHLSYQSIVF